jgi:glycosyltransferase involved in cell wall biosynthesis
MAVSVCIPTYKRHDLLQECLETVFASSIRPLEVVVSDDAHEAELQHLLDTLPRPAGVELRYAANHLGRRQAANVRNAFEQASHEVVVLMHDDDYFLPGGLDALWRAWQANAERVDAVFGRQRVVHADGTLQAGRTQRWNAQFRRLEPGFSPSNLWSALVQQFPMNGMMLRRSVALAAGVPPEAEVGHHTDLHFGIRYALTATRPFLLIADEVSAYRWSPQSIRRSAGVYELDGDLDYAALAALEPRDALERAGKRHALNVASSWAVLALVAKGRRRAALEVFVRHLRGMRARWPTRLKLALVLAGALVGLRWPESMLRRQRLGLPALRSLLPAKRTA